MEIQDYSELRPIEDRVRIPLNGATYYAVANPPAEVIMAATASGIDPETAKRLQASGGTETDLQALAQRDLVLALQLSQAGESQMARAVRFVQAVLTPESRGPFAAALQALPDGASPEQATMHERVAITMPQVLAVFRALIGHYTGRPTVPPSPSTPGDGGTGTSSTESVPLAASTPVSYQPPAS